MNEQLAAILADAITAIGIVLVLLLCGCAGSTLSLEVGDDSGRRVKASYTLPKGFDK